MIARSTANGREGSSDAWEYSPVSKSHPAYDRDVVGAEVTLRCRGQARLHDAVRAARDAIRGMHSELLRGLAYCSAEAVRHHAGRSRRD